MPDTPQIAVIIPVYNAESFIRQTLDAVCHQTWQNLEIIVINDGAKDGTGAICEEIAARDTRIRYYAQANAGVGAARNRGLELARSEYLMFVDADDLLDPDYIETMARELIRSGADMAVSDIDNVDTATGTHTLSVIRLPYGVTECTADRNIISKVRTFCWGKLYRRSLWTEHGIRFPEGELYRTLPGFEDVCCLPLLAARAERITHVRNAAYHYFRGHESSLMHGARFSYFLNAQVETMRRFYESGLEETYHGALRKFMLGQMVSANRWQLTETEIAQMWDFMARYFPELKEMRKYQVYAPEGARRDVLKHIFFDRAQLADDGDDSGRLRAFDIPEPNAQDGDYETYCYDTADRLIDELPELLAQQEENR